MQGARFVGYLVDHSEGGLETVNRALKWSPPSSEHIYHPEKYLRAGEQPRRIFLSRLPRQLGPFKTQSDDVAGEFTVRVLAEEYNRDFAMAEGWRGDRYRSYSDGEYGFSIWLTSWDSKQDAREFDTAMQRILRRQTKIRGRNASTGIRRSIRSGKDVEVWLGVPKEYASQIPRS